MKKGLVISTFAIAFIYAAQLTITFEPVVKLRSADITSINVVSAEEMYLTTQNGGILKSTNNGINFQSIGNPLSNQTLRNNNFNSIYVDGPNIYAGGGEFFNSPGFHFSTDGGNNFEYKGLEGISINEIIPYNNGVLLATTGQGVQFFENNTLSNFGTGLENFTVEALYYDINTPDVVLAGTDIDLYKYDNTSQTWSSTLSFLVVSEFEKGSGDNVYAASFGSIYVSGDLTNFSILPELNLPDFFTINTITYSAPFLYAGIVAADFDNDLPLVHRFNTNTNTWEDNTAGLPKNPGVPQDLVISNGKKFLGTSTGFYIGPIDVEWQNTVEELTAGQYSFVNYNTFNGHYYVGGTEGDLHVASDINSGWTKNDWGLTQGSEIYDFAFTPTGTFVVQLQELWYQENIGDKFEGRNNGLSGIWYTSMAYNPNDNVTVAGTYNGLYYSNDFGVQWLPTNISEFIWKVRYSSELNKFFASTFTDLKHSDGNGQNFETAVENVNPIDFAINDDPLEFKNDPLEFKLGISTNNNFFEYDVNFNSTAIGYAGLDPGDLIEKVGFNFSSNTWMGKYENKLYKYSFDDNEWEEEAVTNNHVTDIMFSLIFNKNPNALDEGIILLATLGGGLLSNAAVTSFKGNEDDVINSYYLEQNYPNPFNPSTTIRYSIPSPSFAQLKVYDVLGKEVATLVNEDKLAGSYEVTFDVGARRGLAIASGYASGVYFYKLQAGSFVETKKMILIK